MADYTNAAKSVADKFKQKTEKKIETAKFDKTYLGKVVSEDTENESWIVYANASTYVIPYDNCDITRVSQSVRVFVPSNNNSAKYAEVIDTDGVPDKIVKVSDNEVYAIYGDIKETWTAEGEDNVRYNFVRTYSTATDDD